MKIIHTADWHLGKNLEKHSRLKEQEEFLTDFIEIVKKNEIELVLIAGDIYDSVNPPAKAEKLFYDSLKKITENGKRLVVVIAGNHDNPERLVAAGPLAMEHGIIMAGTAKTIIPTGQYGKHKVVKSGEGFIEVEVNQERAVLLLVPYLSEKRLDEVLYQDMDTDESKIDSYSQRVTALFQKLSPNFREDTVNLVVSHLFAMGSEEAGSERSIQLGGSYIVSKNCFPENAQYVALGHIHKPQIIPGSKGMIRYAGSPIHYSKNEIAYQKKCFVIEAKANEKVEITEVPIKVYKPIEVWKCSGIEEAIERCNTEKEREVYVFMEIETDRYIREDEMKKMKSYQPDILEITPIFTNITEEKENTYRRKMDFLPLFHEFYQQENGVPAQEETVQMLLDILKEGEE